MWAVVIVVQKKVFQIDARGTGQWHQLKLMNEVGGLRAGGKGLMSKTFGGLNRGFDKTN